MASGISSGVTRGRYSLEIHTQFDAGKQKAHPHSLIERERAFSCFVAMYPPRFASGLTSGSSEWSRLVAGSTASPGDSQAG